MIAGSALLVILTDGESTKTYGEAGGGQEAYRVAERDRRCRRYCGSLRP